MLYSMAKARFDVKLGSTVLVFLLLNSVSPKLLGMLIEVARKSNFLHELSVPCLIKFFRWMSCR